MAPIHGDSREQSLNLDLIFFLSFVRFLLGSGPREKPTLSCPARVLLAWLQEFFAQLSAQHDDDDEDVFS